MKLEIIQTQKIADATESSPFGNIYKIVKPKILSGHYLIKNQFISSASIHEFAQDKGWFRKWRKQSGRFFAGKGDTDFEIMNHNKIKYLRQYSEEKIVNLKGEYLLFQYCWDFNYHHFLISALPRLSIFSKLENRGVKILLRSNTPHYQKAFIEYLFGIDNIFIIDPEINYECESIFIMDFLSGNSKLLAKFFDSIPTDDFDELNFKDIFISRKDSIAKRPLKNENDLSLLMQSLSYKELILSDYSIIEKAIIFRNARNIITTFGAGAANIAFCEKGTLLIYIEHPIYPILEIYEDICKEKNIKLFKVQSRTIKWYLLIFLNKLWVLAGVKRHEWSNSFFWSAPLNKVSAIINQVREL